MVKNHTELALQIWIDLNTVKVLLYEEDRDLDMEEYEKLEKVCMSKVFVHQQSSIVFFYGAVQVKLGCLREVPHEPTQDTHNQIQYDIWVKHFWDLLDLWGGGLEDNSSL